MNIGFASHGLSRCSMLTAINGHVSWSTIQGSGRTLVILMARDVRGSGAQLVGWWRHCGCLVYVVKPASWAHGFDTTTNILQYYRRLFCLDIQVQHNMSYNLMGIGQWLSRKGEVLTSRMFHARQQVAKSQTPVWILRREWASQIASQTKPQPSMSCYVPHE
jgi:hypothetical protein